MCVFCFSDCSCNLCYLYRLMLERPSYAKGSCWYGLGLEVSWYRKAWEHGGHLDGSTGCLTRHRSGTTWAILCNYWPTDTDYTSLISHGLTKIKGWMRIRTVHVDYVDAATLDKKYCVKLKIPECEFPKYHQIFASQGYRVSWFDAYQVKEKVFINVIWVADGQKGFCLKGLSAEQLEENITDKKREGYEPVHIDSYFSCAQLGEMGHSEASNASCLRFAVVFVEGLGPSLMHYNLPFSDFTTRMSVSLSSEQQTLCGSIVCEVYFRWILAKATAAS